MNSCRLVAVLATVGFVAMSSMTAVQACGGDLPKQQTGPFAAGLSPDASTPPVISEGAPLTDPKDIDVQFITGRTHIVAPVCSRVIIASVKGNVTPPQGMIDEVLKDGDVLVVKYPDPFYVDVENLAVRVIQPFQCTVNEKGNKPGAEITTRRAQYSRELTWNKGQMHAHLDVSTDVSPGLYLGRLEGTSPVLEHKHEGSAEILAVVEASGTLTIDGKPQHVGAKEIVVIPRNAVHSWTPDPGTKLLAVQIYTPAGPEKRFIGMDAADNDTGPKDAGDPDSSGPTCNPPWVVNEKGERVTRDDCKPKKDGGGPRGPSNSN